MGKLFFILGKSASGKDTIYRRLLEDPSLGLSPVILYTTRPIREGEADGREYRFITDEDVKALEEAGKVLEKRTYHTVRGDWHYLTADDGQIDLDKKSSLMLGVPTSCRSMQEAFGRDRVVPVYVEVEDGERLIRAIAREKKRVRPQYAEMCRRFLADEEDYREEVLDTLSLGIRVVNNDLEECVSQIRELILQNM